MNEEARKRIIAAMSEVPPDIITVIRERGLRYEERELSGPSALVVPKGKINSAGDPAIIEVNIMDSLASKRYSAAYELMRWVLSSEKLLSQSVGRRNPGEVQKPVRHDTKRWEEHDTVDASTGISTVRLHRLVRQLILPRESLLRQARDCQGDITKLAHIFKVTPDLVSMRLSNLDRQKY